MRVGEILLANGWVDPTSLARAINEQRHTGKRLCSLLIARGLLDPDHASRALGEQHGVAAVLQRHLEHRDRTVVPLLPAVIARSSFAMPIGRSRTGELIVCVRDPRPDVLAVIQQALGGAVIMAVAPASQLESLIEMTYEPSTEEEIDVELATGPIALEDFEHASGPISVIGESLPGTFELVGLDDARVTKDPSQSGQFTSRTSTPAMPRASAPSRTAPTPVSIPVIGRSGPVAKPAPISLDDTLALLDRVTTRDDATDVAMRFAANRWPTTLLMTIKEGAALGHRGYGATLSDDAVQAVAIPLATPTIIKLAHDTRRIATETPPNTGAIQERLARLLGTQKPAAAPIVVASRVAGIIAVGEVGDPDDLEVLAAALGDAYARILREKK